MPTRRRNKYSSAPRYWPWLLVGLWLLACLLGALLLPDQALVLLVFALGLLMVAGIGWWDDHRSLPALPRLCVHLLAGLMLAVLGVGPKAPATKRGLSGVLNLSHAARASRADARVISRARWAMW